MNKITIENLLVLRGINAVIIEKIDRDKLDNYWSRGVYKLVGSRSVNDVIYNIYVWSQEFNPLMKDDFEWIIQKWVSSDYVVINLGD